MAKYQNRVTRRGAYKLREHRKQFCSRGHDRTLPGALTKDSHCKICLAENQRKYRSDPELREEHRRKLCRARNDEKVGRAMASMQWTETYFQLVLAVEHAMPWDKAEAQAKVDAFLAKDVMDVTADRRLRPL